MPTPPQDTPLLSDTMPPLPNADALRHRHPMTTLHPLRLVERDTMPIHCIRRVFPLLAALILASGTLSACGDEQRPDVGELSLRELMGLSSQHVAEMTSSERQRFASRLNDAWQTEISTPPMQEHVVLPDALAQDDDTLRSPLSFIKIIDRERAEQGHDILVSGNIDAEGTEAVIAPIALPADVLGMNFDGSFHVSPLETNEPVFLGSLIYDEAWGCVEEDALQGRSQREMVEDLEPIFRRLLFQIAPDASNARIAPAPRAPVGLGDAEAHRAVLLNPNLLYLLDLDVPADSHGTAPPQDTALVTTSNALTLAFIDTCVVDQQTRCDDCFGANGNHTLPACVSLFPNASESSDPQLECQALAENQGEGFELYCFDLFLEQNISCMGTRDPAGSCGTNGVPAASVSELDGLRIMLTEEFCQEQLNQCEQERLTPTTIPTENDPPAVSSSSGSTSNASSQACVNECLEIGCEVGLQILIQVACQACVESGSSGDGCGSACEGDGMADGPVDEEEQLAASVVFSFPFLFLAGVWWYDRRLFLLGDAEEKPADGEKAFEDSDPEDNAPTP